MDELPELRYDDLVEGTRFPELSYELSPALVAAYVAAVGDDHAAYAGDGAVAPPGLAGIWGRQAYLQGRKMPPGGILAGQDMVFSSPALVGDTLAVRAQVIRRWERKGRRLVTIESTARTSAGEVCGVVRVTAIWPR